MAKKWIIETPADQNLGLFVPLCLCVSVAKNRLFSLPGVSAIGGRPELSVRCADHAVLQVIKANAGDVGRQFLAIRLGNHARPVLARIGRVVQDADVPADPDIPSIG